METEVHDTDSNTSTRAYAQWVVINIKNEMSDNDVSIRNATAIWGKFHANGNKDREIPAEDINKIEIAPKSAEKISACGRENSPSGTEGTIDLYNGSTKIAQLYWNCPWGSSTNNFEVRGKDDGYVVGHSGGSPTGALGNIEVQVIKI